MNCSKMQGCTIFINPDYIANFVYENLHEGEISYDKVLQDILKDDLHIYSLNNIYVIPNQNDLFHIDDYFISISSHSRILENQSIVFAIKSFINNKTFEVKNKSVSTDGNIFLNLKEFTYEKWYERNN